jgi:hypothetical protein
VPGAPYASFRAITAKLGGAYVSQGQTIYYTRVPATCPRGGLRWRTEATFAENGEESKSYTVASTFTTPCPGESAQAPVPETSVPGTGGIVTAPSNKVCVSRRDFPIHVQQIKGLTYSRVSVYVNGKRVAVVKKGRFTATVDLRGLPKGRYVVKIAVLTTSGRLLTGARAYHTCAPKPLPSGKPRL